MNGDAKNLSNTGGENGDSITLALSFEDVVERFENPKDVFDSISEWTEFVGIVSGKPQPVVNGFCAKRDIHIDFFSGPEGGKLHGLERAKSEDMYNSERYVYVGASKRDEVVAEKAGWEYVGIDEASETAGWELS